MNPTKVLLVGSGGREIALLRALLKSSLKPEVIVAPGSDAMRDDAICHEVAVDDIPAMVELAKNEDVDLCIIGPEVPLAMGLADALIDEGISVFGPTRAAARIESSKTYAKDLMMRAGVPTARYETFSHLADALEALEDWPYPLVIKENGLKAGKGVAIVKSKEEAEAHISTLDITDELPLLLEEFLEGYEFSLICLVAGRNFIPLPVAQDYKAIYDHQQGPNTGGMGAVSPIARLDAELYQESIEKVIKPILRAMEEDGEPFTGFLYAGLMATENGVQVIEFNARMGDPEAEVILPRLQGDLLSAIKNLMATDTPPDSTAWETEFPLDPQTSLGVVLSSPGYPGAVTSYPLIPDEFLDEAISEGIEAIHMGTKRVSGGYQAAGGRVLMLTCTGADIADCRSKIYGFLEEHKGLISDFHYRTDIGLAAQ